MNTLIDWARRHYAPYVLVTCVYLFVLIPMAYFIDSVVDIAKNFRYFWRDCLFDLNQRKDFYKSQHLASSLKMLSPTGHKKVLKKLNEKDDCPP